MLKWLEAFLWRAYERSAAGDDQPTQDATSARTALQPPPRNPSNPVQWQAMPCGKRLELGATGFYITLNPDQPEKVYQGFTPEHLRIVTGADLAGMKRYLEGQAKERAEFEPPKGGAA